MFRLDAVTGASATMLRVAALLWRGGGEADAAAAAKVAADAVALMKSGMGKSTAQQEMLALADGLHVSSRCRCGSCVTRDSCVV
jgi:hypothetical protein